MALEKPGKLVEFISPTLWPPCLRYKAGTNLHNFGTFQHCSVLNLSDQQFCGYGQKQNKSSTVAEMGDRLATIDFG